MKLSYVESVYNHYLVSQFLQLLNRSGKKSICENILFKVFLKIKIKVRDNPLFIFFEVIEKVKPIASIRLKVRKKRNKKFTRVIPIQIEADKKYDISLR